MPPVSPPSEHPELFRSALVNLVDRRHPLLRLAGLAQLLRQRRDDRGREKIYALHLDARLPFLRLTEAVAAGPDPINAAIQLPLLGGGAGPRRVALAAAARNAA